MNEEQRGFVENINGTFFSPASSDANHRPYSRSNGGISSSSVWG